MRENKQTFFPFYPYPCSSSYILSYISVYIIFLQMYERDTQKFNKYKYWFYALFRKENIQNSFPYYPYPCSSLYTLSYITDYIIL